MTLAEARTDVLDAADSLESATARFMEALGDEGGDLVWPAGGIDPATEEDLREAVLTLARAFQALDEVEDAS